MGAVLQTAGAAELAAELTCCACSSVCGLIARNAATRAKFRYWSLLLMATVTCIVLLIPGLRQKVYKIPNLCDKIVSPDTCDKLIGFSAVYRILLSLTVFHFLLAILTIRVDRVKSFRARFNNGLWMFKMGIIMGITFGSFYIPKQTGFFRIWMYVSLTGGFMFAMFQIILVIDFGHSWSVSWAAKLETGYTKLWYLAMSVVTIILFAMSFAAAASFYYFFTHPPDIAKCHANVFYIAFIAIQCFVASVVSITPTVQRELAGAGLLQSSVVILYTMYLTFNTLVAEPDSLCNPLGSIIVEYDSYTGVSGQTIFGCMVTLALLIFAFTVRTNTSHLGKYGLALAESEEFAMSQYLEDKHRGNVEKELETGGKEVILGEYVGYNYSFFHMIMSLASLHILMVITNWHSPDENSNLKKLVKNWASVWVQMASSFVSILVYIWFLVTPLVKKVWGPLFGINMPPPKRKGPKSGPANERQEYVLRSKPETGRDKKNSECIDDTEQPKPPSKKSPESFHYETKIPDVKEVAHKEKTSDTKARKVRQVETSFIEGDDSEHQQSQNDTQCISPDQHMRVVQALERSNSILSKASKRLGIETRKRKPRHSEKHDRDQSLDSSRDNSDNQVMTSTYKNNELHNKRNDKRRKEREIIYSSNNSLTSAVSNYISRKAESLRRPKSRNVARYTKLNQEDIRSSRRKRHPSESDRQFDNEYQSKGNSIANLHDKEGCVANLHDNVSRKEGSFANLYDRNSRKESSTANLRDNVTHKEGSTTNIHEKDSRKGTNTIPKNEKNDNLKKRLVEEDSTIKQKLKEYNNSLEAISKSRLDLSVVPSVFSRKAQQPEVAKEILKLQWKILRSQAKMVKIQERIIRLQAEEQNEDNITQLKPPPLQAPKLQSPPLQPPKLQSPPLQPPPPIENNEHKNEHRTRRKTRRRKELG